MSKSRSVRAGRILDAEVHLLDRQVLDKDGMPVTTVDDLELSDIPFGTDLPVGDTWEYWLRLKSLGKIAYVAEHPVDVRTLEGLVRAAA